MTTPTLAQPRERFREIARGALANAHTQAAADAATLRMLNGRVAGWADLPDVEALRERVLVQIREVHIEITERPPS